MRFLESPMQNQFFLDIFLSKKCIFCVDKEKNKKRRHVKYMEFVKFLVSLLRKCVDNFRYKKVIMLLHNEKKYFSLRLPYFF